MEETNITIGNKQYKVTEAKTEEQKREGLSGYDELPEGEGMLFYMDDEKSQQVFTMKEMKFPLDILFINQDQEVVSANHDCKPGQESVVNTTEHMEEGDYIAYVLEVNPGSGIEVGDSFDFEEDTPVMKVLFPDGSEQMALYGGERIFSRKNTRVLIKKAKKAAESMSDSDYKTLGKYMFKCIKIQDEREPEYVQAPTKEE